MSTVSWHSHPLWNNKIRFKNNSSMVPPLNDPQRNFIAPLERIASVSEFEFARTRLSCIYTYPQRCRLPHSRCVLLVWVFLEIWREWPPPSPVLSPIWAHILTNSGWNVWTQTCCSPAPRPSTNKLLSRSNFFPKNHLLGVWLGLDWAGLLMPGIRNWVSQSEKIGRLQAGRLQQPTT